MGQHVTNDDDLNAAYGAWIRALEAMTSSAVSAELYRRARYRSALTVSRALTEHADGSPLTRSVIYGIWLHAGLVYIGQTSDSPRRLWDLSVGESHHLANTFPCDIWTRVVVLAWPAVLGVEDGVSPDLTGIGPALEFSLQQELNPLFNASKRTRAGEWRQHVWTASRSRAARQATTLVRESDLVLQAWRRLADLPIGVRGVAHTQEGRAVAPQELLKVIDRATR